LLDDGGRPIFNVTLYAVRKDGQTGSASLRKGYEHVVLDGDGARRVPCEALLDI
jgi:hypothetical protein